MLLFQEQEIFRERVEDKYSIRGFWMPKCSAVLLNEWMND